jgi:hypothetical protein
MTVRRRCEVYIIWRGRRKLEYIRCGRAAAAGTHFCAEHQRFFPDGPTLRKPA